MWSHTLRRPRPSHVAARPRRARWILEVLEDRLAPAVFNVNSLADILTPPAGVVTLRSAIQAANATSGGNTINLTVPGSYGATAIRATFNNTAGELAITGTSDLTIVNTSGGAASVDGGGLNRVFDINPAAAVPFTVTFQGLTITNGSATGNDAASSSGGGIRAQGAASVVLNNVVVSGNAASADGGGIALVGATSTGTLTVNAGVIRDNHASIAGGGIETDGTGLVTINPGSAITANTAAIQGGGVWLDAGGASLVVAGATLSHNTAFTGVGGGIGNSAGGTVTIAASTVADNASGASGGGFGDAGTTGKLIVQDSSFLRNTALTNGGGIREGGPSSSIADSTIEGNVAQGGGGGLAATGGIMIVTDSRIAGNTATGGGGILDAAPTLTVSFSTVEDNHAFGTSGGGGILVSVASNLTVANSLFRNNSASFPIGGGGFGGGINQPVGTLAISSSQFTGNVAINLGGAVLFEGTALTVAGSTFDHNRTFGDGGALRFGGTASSSLTNDTFAFNTAGGGGAILLLGGGPLTLLNDTINGNTAGVNGGGIYLVAGALVIQNTIIAQDTTSGTGPDVFTVAGHPVTDNGGNLVTNTAGSTGFGAGTLTVNPLLGRLQDNGGQLAGAAVSRQVVFTESLLLGSPAIAKGVAAGAPATDERGFPDPSEAPKPSIGAYEPQYGATATATANQVYVENLFEVLLNRPADPASSAAFVNLLTGGTSRIAVVQLIEGTVEYRTIQAQLVYQRYLHRAPDAAGLNGFLNFLGSGGTVEQATAFSVGSPEYFQLHGGSNDGFLQALYADALNRTPALSELASWIPVLGGGTSRTTVASLFLAAPEYLTNLVQADFLALLGRPAEPGVLVFFVQQLQSGATHQNVVAVILGSDEAFLERTTSAT